MKAIIIDGKVINLTNVHFVRREAPDVLLISFGSDFIRIKNSPRELDTIFNKIYRGINEELSSNN